jgi:PHP family Zn ribbon phosphoesterase
MNGIRTGKGVTGTIEFFPEEGKYHIDGHRDCGFSCFPSETISRDGICPTCGKQLTVGVLYRVEKLADRTEGQDNSTSFVSIIPLVEILSDVIGKGPATKSVQSVYTRMLENLGNEFSILLDAPADRIAAASSEAIAAAIIKVRQGDVRLSPGFDGQFGTIKIPQ